MHYNKIDNTAVCRITLSGETLPAVQQAVQESGVVIPFKKPAREAKTSSNKKDEPSNGSSSLFPSAVRPRQEGLLHE
jgi:hypothetical protein